MRLHRVEFKWVKKVDRTDWKAITAIYLDRKKDLHATVVYLFQVTMQLVVVDWKSGCIYDFYRFRSIFFLLWEN